MAVVVATLSAYLSLAALVLLRLESPRVLLALVWLFPVAANCFSLVAAQDGSKGNLCLKRDMLLSSGFIASLLLLLDPHWQNWVTVGLGAVVLSLSDLFGIDSRRDVLARAQRPEVAA